MSHIVYAEVHVLCTTNMRIYTAYEHNFITGFNKLVKREEGATDLSTCSNMLMSHESWPKNQNYAVFIFDFFHFENNEPRVLFQDGLFRLRRFGPKKVWQRHFSMGRDIYCHFLKKVGLRFNDKSNYTQNISHIFLTQQKIYSTLHNAMDRIETK